MQKKFERVRIVGGSLPQEARIAVSKKKMMKNENMPGEMLYPETVKVRANFFIPIISIASFTAPFIILWQFYSNLHALPVLSQLLKSTESSGFCIRIDGEFSYGLYLLLFMGMPSAMGLASYLLLSRIRKPNAPTKVLLWLVIVIIACLVESVLSTFVHFGKVPALGK